MKSQQDGGDTKKEVSVRTHNSERVASGPRACGLVWGSVAGTQPWKWVSASGNLWGSTTNWCGCSAPADSRVQGGEEALVTCENPLITCGFLGIGMDMSLEIHLVLLLLTSSRGT